MPLALATTSTSCCGSFTNSSVLHRWSDSTSKRFQLVRALICCPQLDGVIHTKDLLRAAVRSGSTSSISSRQLTQMMGVLIPAIVCLLGAVFTFVAPAGLFPAHLYRAALNISGGMTTHCCAICYIASLSLSSQTLRFYEEPPCSVALALVLL